MEEENWIPKKKNPLHYQDPRGSAKTIFLDSLSACKDMQLQVPDFGGAVL